MGRAMGCYRPLQLRDGGAVLGGHAPRLERQDAKEEGA